MEAILQFFCNRNNFEQYFKPVYNGTTATNGILALPRGNIRNASNGFFEEFDGKQFYVERVQRKTSRTFVINFFPTQRCRTWRWNSLALHSFGPIYLHKFNYAHEDMLALYVTAGTFSSFGANLYNSIRRPVNMGMPGLVPRGLYWLVQRY